MDMVCLRSVVVQRDGVNIWLKPGKTYDLTGQEIVDIRKVSKNHIRNPKNEGFVDVVSTARGPGEEVDPELARLGVQTARTSAQTAAPPKGIQVTGASRSAATVHAGADTSDL